MLFSQARLLDQKEIYRKSLHLPGLILIWLWPKSPHFFLALLVFFVMIYTLSQILELKTGRSLPFIGHMTQKLKRETPFDWGPPLLAFGIGLSLYFFYGPGAFAGVIMVCLSDGVAAVMGKAFGQQKLFYNSQKSYLGSLSFFTISFLATLIFLPTPIALYLSLIGTFIESLPIGVLDNLTIPLGISIAYQVLGRLAG